MQAKDLERLAKGLGYNIQASDYNRIFRDLGLFRRTRLNYEQFKSILKRYDDPLTKKEITSGTHWSRGVRENVLREARLFDQSNQRFIRMRNCTVLILTVSILLILMFWPRN